MSPAFKLADVQWICMADTGAHFWIMPNSCECGLKISLPLPKYVSSALPCLVRELCEPAGRSLQLI